MLSLTAPTSDGAVGGASIVFRATTNLVGLCAARCGELIVITPHHPTHAVTVLTPDATAVRRHRGEGEADIARLVPQFLQSGALAFLVHTDAEAWAVLQKGTEVTA